MVVCGQDIILDILCNYLESAPYNFRAYRSRQGSYNGLYALYQGQVSVATAHLWDGDTDTYNICLLYTSDVYKRQLLRDGKRFRGLFNA